MAGYPPWALCGLSKLEMKAPRIEEQLDFVLPEGYHMSSEALLETDYEQLAACLAAAYGIQHSVWDLERIPKVFIENKDVKKTFLLWHENTDGSSTIVGTASLKILPQDFPGSGYVHWVAVHPDHQGRGLAMSLCLAVLREARDVHGCTTSVLHTVDTSIPAIVTYGKLGFLPVNTDDTHADRWEEIKQKINLYKKN